MYTIEDNPPHYELTQNYTANGSDKHFNILFINDGINTYIMYISDIEALTGFRYCNICHKQAFSIGDTNLQVQMRNHMKKCQNNDGKIVKKFILEKFTKPFVPHILSNKTYKYLLANNLTHLFKPTRYYITYDIETLENKINEKNDDSSQVTATLIPYAIVSTVKLTSGIHSFYYDIRTENFLDKWLEQLFEEAKQVKKDNKYIDETFPQYYEVPVIRFNSAKFDASVLFKNLKSKDWIISKYLGSRCCKRFWKWDLQKKGRFPHEFINTKNYMNELNKSEPFPIETFDNKLRNKKLSEVKYKEYLVAVQQLNQSEAAKHKTRWDYLKHYNMLDTRVLIEPIDYLIELMFKYKVDMLANISMFSEDPLVVDKMLLFVAEIKGHTDERYINEVINWGPILRNIDITTNKETTGEFMYNHLVDHQLPHDKTERKLTNLVDTNNEVMSFNNYYLWLLIDSCYLVIDEIVSVTTFTKHTNFNSFVKEFMNLRQQAKDAQNEGLGQFRKLILNSAFGCDALNSEKYSNTRLLSANKTFVQHLKGGFIHSTELNEDLYAVQVDRENCRCNTCLQVAYFVLDSAKFWYVNFIYNFMNKAYDMNKMHFVQGDTDSLTWAISDNLNRGPDQLFEEVIKDQGFFDTYKDCVYTDNGQKQILHIGVEKQDCFERCYFGLESLDK
ncbi:MAG: hypothetical protein EZS28_020623 [Streblomastix strix]|uniref:DNA-directed DNA polymerase n=1 Tax=Streblomastix strix TaxID=222440 RepID=A0A5J4VNK8_9EUKA|nr:MAG: hypothetical protein EZS28_020623 [Streblomastix strix]